MEIHVGTDIIEVSRIKDAMKDENFAKRVFTEKEIEYCERRGDLTKYQSYAARFAAKEAVFKAISPILNNKYEISWKNIEILKEENGRPKINIIDIDLNKIKIDVSLSHVKETAVATAIATIEE